MSNFLRDKDIKAFTMSCLGLTGATFVMEIFGFPLMGKIITSVACLALLGVYSMLVKEFRSAFMNLILAAIVLNLIGEITLMWDKELEKYTNPYWAFVVFHLIRNVALFLAYFWNVLKSEIYNQLWIKALPYVVSGIIIFIIQKSWYSNETHWGFMLAFNISTGLMLIGAGLRTNHTSDGSLYLGLISACFFLISDLIATTGHGNFAFAIRSCLLILGTYGTIRATFDHVSHYKLTVKNRIYLKMPENVGTKLEPMI